MRTYLLLVAFAGLPAIAQTETNIACVERLDIPTYPPLAKQARISGVLTGVVLLGADGSVAKISSEWAPASKKEGMFASAVEESIRASAFAKSCAGKQVKLVFNFVLSEAGTSTQIKFSFGYPNQFRIDAPLRMNQVD
jgi:outer membrane biosynthesis protein TonB